MTTDEIGEIAVIGGTGALGGGLCRRWAKAGLSVIVGSRNAGKAAAFAETLPVAPGGPAVIGLGVGEAAARGQIVVLAVPFASQAATLAEIAAHIQGKILLDTTVPLVPPKVARVQLPPEDSAAIRAQSLAGEGVRVISAFHNVAAKSLLKEGPIACDILVFGDDAAARDVGVVLVGRAGLRGVHGGPLANSAAAEALTSVLISINKRYGADGAGIVITGIG